jgi:hypothetical protein
MTTAPICCQPQDSVEHVAKLMAQHDCGVIPVCSGGRLAGLITVGTAARATAGRDDEDGLHGPRGRQRAGRDRHDGSEAGAPPAGRRQKRQSRVFASMNVADFLLAVSYWSRRPVPAAV